MPAIKTCLVYVNTGNKTLENHSILTQGFYHITVFSYQLPGHSYLGQSVFCLFFDGSLFRVIALPTIAIAIVVALSRS